MVVVLLKVIREVVLKNLFDSNCLLFLPINMRNAIVAVMTISVTLTKIMYSCGWIWNTNVGFLFFTIVSVINIKLVKEINFKLLDPNGKVGYCHEAKGRKYDPIERQG